MPKPLTRRALLRGVGAAIPLPFLEAMLPRLATAAPAPRRLVILFSANGTVHSNFFPASGAGPLAALPAITAKFDPLKGKLLLVNGIKMMSAYDGVGNGHVQGMACNLTATENKTWSSGGEYANGVSVDQLIASRIGKATRFPSLEVGFGASTATGNVRSYVSYSAPGQPVPLESDPVRLFDRLFKDLPATNGGEAARPPSRRNRVVLDAVLDDVKSLQGSLGPGDRRILDAHLTSIREIEGRLTQVAMPTAAGCQKPSAPQALDKNDSTYPARAKLILDMLARAMICDLTRVATFMWTGSGGKGLSYLNIASDHHSLAHENAVAELTKLEAWYAEQMAAFAAQLDAADEGGTSVLDSSAVMWTHEIAQGPLHPRNNLHYAILGSCGGAIRTGRALSFADKRSTNDLLLALVHAMGVTDVQTFGNAKYVQGPLPLG